MRTPTYNLWAFTCILIFCLTSRTAAQDTAKPQKGTILKSAEQVKQLSESEAEKVNSKIGKTQSEISELATKTPEVLKRDAQKRIEEELKKVNVDSLGLGKALDKAKQLTTITQIELPSLPKVGGIDFSGLKSWGQSLFKGLQSNLNLQTGMAMLPNQVNSNSLLGAINTNGFSQDVGLDLGKKLLGCRLDLGYQRFEFNEGQLEKWASAQAPSNAKQIISAKPLENFSLNIGPSLSFNFGKIRAQLALQPGVSMVANVGLQQSQNALKMTNGHTPSFSLKNTLQVQYPLGERISLTAQGNYMNTSWFQKSQSSTVPSGEFAKTNDLSDFSSVSVGVSIKLNPCEPKKEIEPGEEKFHHYYHRLRAEAGGDAIPVTSTFRFMLDDISVRPQMLRVSVVPAGQSVSIADQKPFTDVGKLVGEGRFLINLTNFGCEKNKRYHLILHSPNGVSHFEMLTSLEEEWTKAKE